MTFEQYMNLKPDNVLKYGQERYRLLVKDPLGKWVTEVIDETGTAQGFRKLKFKDSIVEHLQLVE